MSEMPSDFASFNRLGLYIYTTITRDSETVFRKQVVLISDTYAILDFSCFN
jgi:hypothetical protein